MLRWLLKKTKRIPYSRAQDAFQRKSLSIIQMFLEQKTLLLAIGTFLLLVGGFFPIRQYYKEQAEIKAQSQLYLSTAKWEALKKAAPPKTTLNPDEPALPTQEQQDQPLKDEDYKQLQVGYERVIQNHQGTKGAVLAALQLANLHINQGDTKGALYSMRQVESTLNTENIIDAVALMSLASLYADNQQCTKAIEIWSKIIDASDFSFFHGDALLKQGLCFEQMKNTDMAYQNYQKLEMDYGDFPSGQMAQRLLHLMDKK